MKLNKMLTTLLLTIMMLTQFSLIQLGGLVYAADENTNQQEEIVETKSIVTTIVPTNEETKLNDLKPGETFEVKIELSEYNNIVEGLLAITGRLEYSKDVLEIVPKVYEDGTQTMLVAASGWERMLENNMTSALKFITTGTHKMKEGTLATVTFKVKENISENTNAVIKVTNISASDGEYNAVSQDAILEVAVVMPVVQEPSIESNIYEIDNNNNVISKITVGTTVEEFKKNITSYGELVFKDKDGNILNENSKIGTGATLTVGEKLHYTFAVTYDVNGDADLTVSDLVSIKLHLIETETLEGIYAKVADIDSDNNLSINDVARLKLVLIGLEN